MLSQVKISMAFLCTLLASLVTLISLSPTIQAVNETEQANAETFLKRANIILQRKEYEFMLASWDYSTNITQHNSKRKVNASLSYSKVYAKIRNNASKFDVKKLKEDAARQISFLRMSSALKNESELKEQKQLGSKLSELYSTAKVGGKSLDPDLVKLMSTSRDYNKLLHSWWGWRNASGRKMRPIYKRFVELSNRGARENGYIDQGQVWRSWYEVENLDVLVENLWNDLKPLYFELHAYVRHKLTKVYPGKVSEDDYIEAHLLGNMWAQSWVDIFHMVKPYENKASIDITSNLKNDSRYNSPVKLTKLAESFFVSLGLKPLPPAFYNKSLLHKPTDREVVCHASAWDFALHKDVRIKQCVQINHNHLVTLHHELGHIQYFLEYWHLPIVYRTGANPGFHEAVGDLMSLSVDTPTHLKTLGLLKNYESDKEADINALMKMAMRKIAFLPFGYLIDQWRWKVFNGVINDSNYNAEWWRLRKKHQGIKSPVERSENDFDPGAKFHIPSNVPYIRYFISYVLQFQFHKAACEAAKFDGPLYKCSIYNSTAAGEKIGDMLKMGKSKHWQFALEKLTGGRNMSVAPIKEYFKPLQEWLVKERCNKKYKIGWPEQPAREVEKCNTNGGAYNWSIKQTFLLAVIFTFIHFFS